MHFQACFMHFDECLICFEELFFEKPYKIQIKFITIFNSSPPICNKCQEIWLFYYSFKSFSFFLPNSHSLDKTLHHIADASKEWFKLPLHVFLKSFSSYLKDFEKERETHRFWRQLPQHEAFTIFFFQRGFFTLKNCASSKRSSWSFPRWW